MTPPNSRLLDGGLSIPCCAARTSVVVISDDV